eukprot:g36550.t1
MYTLLLVLWPWLPTGFGYTPPMPSFIGSNTHLCPVGPVFPIYLSQSFQYPFERDSLQLGGDLAALCVLEHHSELRLDFCGGLSYRDASSQAFTALASYNMTALNARILLRAVAIEARNASGRSLCEECYDSYQATGTAPDGCVVYDQDCRDPCGNASFVDPEDMLANFSTNEGLACKYSQTIELSTTIDPFEQPLQLSVCHLIEPGAGALRFLQLAVPLLPHPADDPALANTDTIQETYDIDDFFPSFPTGPREYLSSLTVRTANQSYGLRTQVVPPKAKVTGLWTPSLRFGPDIAEAAASREGCMVEVSDLEVERDFPSQFVPSQGTLVAYMSECVPDQLSRVLVDTTRLQDGWHRITLRHYHAGVPPSFGNNSFLEFSRETTQLLTSSSFLFYSQAVLNTSKCLTPREFQELKGQHSGNCSFMGPDGRCLPPPPQVKEDNSTQLPVETYSWPMLSHAVVRNGKYRKQSFYSGTLPSERASRNFQPKLQDRILLFDPDIDSKINPITNRPIESRLLMALDLPTLSGQGGLDVDGVTMPRQWILRLHLAELHLGNGTDLTLWLGPLIPPARPWGGDPGPNQGNGTRDGSSPPPPDGSSPPPPDGSSPPPPDGSSPPPPDSSSPPQPPSGGEVGGWGGGQPPPPPPPPPGRRRMLNEDPNSPPKVYAALQNLKEHTATWDAVPWKAYYGNKVKNFSFSAQELSVQNQQASDIWLELRLDAIELTHMCDTPNHWHRRASTCYLALTANTSTPGTSLQLLAVSSRSSTHAPYIEMEMVCEPPPKDGGRNDRKFTTAQTATYSALSAVGGGLAVAMFGVVYLRNKKMRTHVVAEATQGPSKRARRVGDFDLEAEEDDGGAGVGGALANKSLNGSGSMDGMLNKDFLTDLNLGPELLSELENEPPDFSQDLLHGMLLPPRDSNERLSPLSVSAVATAADIYPGAMAQRSSDTDDGQSQAHGDFQGRHSRRNSDDASTRSGQTSSSAAHSSEVSSAPIAPPPAPDYLYESAQAPASNKPPGGFPRGRRGSDHSQNSEPPTSPEYFSPPESPPKHGVDIGAGYKTSAGLLPASMENGAIIQDLLNKLEKQQQVHKQQVHDLQKKLAITTRQMLAYRTAAKRLQQALRQAMQSNNRLSVSTSTAGPLSSFLDSPTHRPSASTSDSAISPPPPLVPPGHTPQSKTRSYDTDATFPMHADVLPSPTMQNSLELAVRGLSQSSSFSTSSAISSLPIPRTPPPPLLPSLGSYTTSPQAASPPQPGRSGPSPPPGPPPAENNKHANKICPECGKVFKSKFSRDRHMKTHKAVVDDRYVCSCHVCGREYTEVSNLRRHLRNNHGIEPSIGKQDKLAPARDPPTPTAPASTTQPPNLSQLGHNSGGPAFSQSFSLNRSISGGNASRLAANLPATSPTLVHQRSWQSERTLLTSGAVVTHGPTTPTIADLGGAADALPEPTLRLNSDEIESTRAEVQDAVVLVGLKITNTISLVL